MPVWTVQVLGDEDERVEAGMLVCESGALVALSEECLVVRAWAPGQWRTVRHIKEADRHPEAAPSGHESVLVGLPGR